MISRVTGGDPSEIRGTLRSTIPDADVWLLNPSGVVFGEGAQLDVPGSFHASTGDSLGFGDGGLERFYSDPSRPSVLSTARPDAFGFLGESAAAPISVTGAVLKVDAREGIELAGGDVTLTGATLDAPGGAVSIRGGRIVVEEGSKVLAENAGEEPAGTITVEGSESVVVDGSLMSTSTNSSGDAGTVRLEGGDVTLRNGPGLANAYVRDDPLNLPHRVTVGARAETTGSGDAGRIEVDAESLTVTAGAGLSAQTVGPDGVFASGDGGVIDIQAGSMLVSDLGFATVESWRSAGDAGSIAVDAESLTVDATRADGKGRSPTSLTANSLVRRPVLVGTALELGPAYEPDDVPLGRPGRIEVSAKALHLRNGGWIESNCFDCTTRAGTILLSIESFVGEGRELRGSLPSLVAAAAFGPEGRGEGGLIEITGLTEETARSLVFRDGGLAGDNGATIRVHADRVELLDGGHILVSSFSPSNAGIIEIHAGSVLIEGTGPGPEFAPSGIYAGANSTGQGGDIVLHVAGSLEILRGGELTALTVGSGDAGAI